MYIRPSWAIFRSKRETSFLNFEIMPIQLSMKFLKWWSIFSLSLNIYDLLLKGLTWSQTNKYIAYDTIRLKAFHLIPSKHIFNCKMMLLCAFISDSLLDPIFKGSKWSRLISIYAMTHSSFILFQHKANQFSVSLRLAPI